MTDEMNDEINGEEESFADLFEQYRTGMSEDIQVGDKVKGEIIAIGKDTVFLDTGTKIDGVVEKVELLDESGELPYKEGDSVELYVVSHTGNEIRLSKALSGIGGLRAIEEAFEKSVPVEGKVKSQCKGGVNVEIMQRRAFCPVSQIDLKYVEKPEDYVGETHLFLVTQFEENGNNIVISRRKLLEQELQEEKEEFLKNIKVNSQYEGKVTKLMPYGAFVELFPGIEGMVHLSELSWSRVEKPEDALVTKEVVPVKIIGIEENEKAGQLKISLSIKQVTGDPWESVGEKFSEGEKTTGKVVRCTNFGAFVEIAPGIDGLVHISEMSYKKRVLKPEDEVNIGDMVPVMIKEIDGEHRRISLSIKDAEGDPWVEVPQKYKSGQTLQGIIENKEKFGFFITLEPGITGLLPQSRIKRSSKPSAIEKLRQGDTISVIIDDINVDDRRITLNVGDSRDEGDWKAFSADSKKSLGSLGEKLQKALDEKKAK